MKKLHLSTTIIICSTLFITIGCNTTSTPVEARVFEPGKISTEAIEYALSFSSSGSELYFSRSNGQWGKGSIQSSIYYSVKENQEWSEPKLVSFSGEYDDSAPFITKDDRTIYFISKRPSEGIDSISQDIWKVERNKDGEWGTPFRLDSTINSSKNEYGLRADQYDNLYFASDRDGGYGQGDIYMLKKTDNHYGLPFNLGDAINTEYGEWNLEINQEGDMIIFEASQREQNLSPYGDLYISFKVEEEWSVPQNIQEINTTGSDLFPELIEEENILYYSSSDSLKSVRVNIYSIAFSDIYEAYRESAVFSKE